MPTNNRVKLRTVIIVPAIYLFFILSVAEAGIGVLFLFLVYIAGAIAGGNALLGWDLGVADRESQTFRKTKPLRGLGAVLGEFQYVFYHKDNLLDLVVKEIDSRLHKLGPSLALQHKSYGDTDKNLRSPDKRDFLVLALEPNLRGTELALAIHIRQRAEAQSIQWWVLGRGVIDQNRRLILLASAPVALPFWLWQSYKQELDFVSYVRTMYIAFYNSLDVTTEARALHTLVFDAVVDTLDKHGVDISDLKQQRAQVMNISISGGRARFGNIVQAFQQANLVKTGTPR